ncbi:putative zinc finger A20 and AN1 domain-containing stress-associated protein 8-like isoform X2 [Capsicum annuum]|nr:putative zinc finger A20 and AN1 domain-containing stress-associated protein 8-like isoform X2 [Capsicum annuum]KAF3665224.1 putative zinc finger A20 and AN1 domain-containing stress-associated protein 8-like isoform X2 [Capsicum annuum]
MTMATTSSSSFLSTLVLCLIVAFLMTPTTSNPLAKVCIKSKNPRFCLQVLGLNPHLSPYELTLEAINLAMASASGTTKKIHTFLDQTKDDNLKVIYNSCLNFYQSVIDTLTSTEEHFLKEGQYYGVNVAGNIAQLDSFQCETAFQSIIGYAYESTLTKDNENLRIFGSIVVSAIDCLYNSTSLKW